MLTIIVIHVSSNLDIFKGIHFLFLSHNEKLGLIYAAYVNTTRD